MVKLRLRRVGKKKHPIYKIVAADSRSPRDGRYLEVVGNYDPNTNPISLAIKADRAFYWLRKGAQPTHTVRSLMKRDGMWLRWSLTKRGDDETKQQSIIERWNMVQAGKATREADRKVRRAERKKKATEAKTETPAAEAPAAS